MLRCRCIPIARGFAGLLWVLRSARLMITPPPHARLLWQPQPQHRSEAVTHRTLAGRVGCVCRGRCEWCVLRGGVSGMWRGADRQHARLGTTQRSRVMGYCTRLLCAKDFRICVHAGSSLMASPGKLRSAPGPCACTAAQSYALAASSSDAKRPMCCLPRCLRVIQPRVP
jgi:hypothetical protein